MRVGCLLSAVFVLIFLVICSVSASSTVVGDPSYDRPFGDLPGMPILLPANSTSATCAALCNNNQGLSAWTFEVENLSACVAWAFGVDSAKCDAPLSCWLKGNITMLLPNPCRVSGTKTEIRTVYTLAPAVFTLFPIGQVTPFMWLYDQMMLQAEGLAGHLQYFYPYIANSSWIGGMVDDPYEVNERVPYWLNGVVPLVYQLDNVTTLRVSAESYLNYISTHQNASGWLGPVQSDLPGLDPWPRYPLLLAYKAHYEATNDGNTLAFLYFLRNLIEQQPLSVWAQYRYMDLQLILHWALDTNLPPSQQYWFDFAETVNNQGFDWKSFYTSPQFPTSACLGSCQTLATHGVNNGQALKSGAVWWRQSRNNSDVTTTYQRIALLQQYHGQADGMFSCSEHLAGLVPSQGAELCTIVESMFSYEVIANIFGDLTMLDRVEQLAYNALPAAIDPHMWSHVYLNQPNNIASENCDPPIYVSDGPQSNIYGLEPNYGCCTVNFPQGWPKFIANMYALVENASAIAVLLYGPSVLNTTINGKSVYLVQKAWYPFSGMIIFSITSDGPFTLYLRIPGWAVGANVTHVGSGGPQPAPAGELFPVSLTPELNAVAVQLPMALRVVQRPNGAVSLYWGPILLALQINENWTQLAYHNFNSSDWQITPLSPWAFALLINSTSPSSSCSVMNNAPGAVPFAPPTAAHFAHDEEHLNGATAATSIIAKCQGRAIPWSVYNQAATTPPASPVTSTDPLVTLTLVPYGATQLRISEFPVLAA